MSQSNPVTILPAPRQGYLVEQIDLMLDDGKVVPGYRELTQDDYEDQYGIEATKVAVARRDEALEDIESFSELVEVSGQEDAPESDLDAFTKTIMAQRAHDEAVATFFAKQKADAVEMLKKAIAEIEAGNVGSLALVVLPQVGPTAIANVMPLAPGMYERSLGLLTRLTTLHALNPTAI